MKSLGVSLLGAAILFVTLSQFGAIGLVVLGVIGIVLWIAAIGFRALKMPRSGPNK